MSWKDFEYVLSLIVENRILKVYVGYLVEQNSRTPINLDDNALEKLPKKKKPKRVKPKQK